MPPFVIGWRESRHEERRQDPHVEAIVTRGSGIADSLSYSRRNAMRRHFIPHSIDPAI